MLSADTVGAAQVMVDKSVAYALERKQFGRLIGSFQAVKHMCAEMAAELEPCYSLVWHAAHSFDNNETNKDEIDYKGRTVKLLQFKLKSAEDLPDDKKLDFDIWLNQNEGIIFKVKYNRLGSWEYRLKNYE